MFKTKTETFEMTAEFDGEIIEFLIKVKRKRNVMVVTGHDLPPEFDMEEFKRKVKEALEAHYRHSVLVA